MSQRRCLSSLDNHINEFSTITPSAPTEAGRTELSILRKPSDADTTAVGTLNYFSVRHHIRLICYFDKHSFCATPLENGFREPSDLYEARTTPALHSWGSRHDGRLMKVLSAELVGCSLRPTNEQSSHLRRASRTDFLYHHNQRACFTRQF